jgi:uncharacterized protein YggE
MRGLGFVAVLGIVAPLAGQEASRADVVPPPVVVTSAQGEARVTPDRATIFIGVETRGSTAARASADNARKQRSVIDTLRVLGVAASDIATVSYNVSPEQRYRPEQGDTVPKVVGYVVSNTVRVEVRALAQLGALIDAALAKGANAINSLQFYSSNEDAARRSALAAAVERARGDAAALAAAAGGNLGELLEVSSSAGFPPRPYAAVMARRVDAAEATPISPGEQTVTVTVTARWKFVGGREVK